MPGGRENSLLDLRHPESGLIGIVGSSSASPDVEISPHIYMIEPDRIHPVHIPICQESRNKDIANVTRYSEPHMQTDLILPTLSPERHVFFLALWTFLS